MTGIEIQAMEHLTRLSAGIGPRPGGSPGNQAAAGYIQAAMTACGLVTARQEYPVPDWELVETRLELDGKPLKAAANPFSPACDLTAPIQAAGTIAELQAARLDGC